MALSILTYPVNTSSLTNEMIFVINEATKANDEVTYPNYKYVLDLYVDSVLVARIKANPDPENRLGIFNVSNILKNYATYLFLADYSNYSELINPRLAYRVKLGEEYSDTLYPNLLNDSVDRYSIKSYAAGPYSSTAILSDNSYFTNADETYTFKDSKWCLLSFYKEDYTGGTVDVSITAYNEDGSTAWTSLYDDEPITDAYLLQLNFGFQKLITLIGLNQTQQDNTDYIIVSILGYTFRINYLCENIFDVKTLAFLNQYGAYETADFSLVSKKEIEISRKDFAQLPYRINASGVISYSSNGAMYGSRKNYSANVMTRMKLTSHLLTDDNYTWLADLFRSNDVYMYDSVLDKFCPVRITQNNYEYRTFLNSRLTALEFMIEFSEAYNSQHL